MRTQGSGEDYQDTGVPWLGKVPANWRIRRLKRFAQFSGGGTPNREKSEYWNGGIPWVSPKDMKSEFVASSEETISQLGLENSSATLRPAGEILLVVRSGILQHTIPVAINRVPVALNQDMKALTLDPQECLPIFLLRWVQGFNDQLLLAWGKQGATVESIEHSYLSETLVPLPSLTEQISIAAFLHRETGKIDALVEEQKRLIELLKEKRQAVISHAVTKGLDPSAPMKPSEVEWLGGIPKHWEVRRLKAISPHITVGIVVEPSKYYSETGIPALRSLNIRPGAITHDNMVFITEAANTLLAKSQLHAGDLVAVRSGQPGTTAVVPQDLDGCNCIDLIIIRKPTEGSEWFLCWYLSSDVAVRQFSEGSGGAIQQHFNIGTAMNLVVTSPPEHEQRAIADFLDRETQKIDALVNEVEKAIELMAERRSALISSAVTGKIDAREVVGAETVAA